MAGNGLKIYKSLSQHISNDKFKSEFGYGTLSFASWERLLPYIEHIVGKKPNEKIDETGITIKFKHENVQEKEFKKFTEKYIGDMIEQEKEVGEKIFYEKMDIVEQIKYDTQKKREEDQAEVLKCNWFEKICFIIAQIAACILPFSLLAALKSEGAGYFSLELWITCTIMLLLLRHSRSKRTGEKSKILFLPIV